MSSAGNVPRSDRKVGTETSQLFGLATRTAARTGHFTFLKALGYSENDDGIFLVYMLQ